LALPIRVAPAGFLPSATALVGVWLFFVGQSLVVVEMIVNEARRRNEVGSVAIQALESSSNTAVSSAGRSRNAVEATTQADVGLPSIARRALGGWGETAVSSLLVVLTMTTLVSQISKAGTMAAPAFSPSLSTFSLGNLGSYRAACATAALSFGALVFAGGVTTAARVNVLLAGVFAVSGAVLFTVGAPRADWTRLWNPCNWQAASQSIPTFLQLLVYSEILPSVCVLLKHQLSALRIAVVLGSLLPLLVEVAWAGLGLGLTPLPPLSSVVSGGAAASSTVVASVVDPVNLLLKAGGPVQWPLMCLAAAAVSTTVVGSYLALGNTFSDLLTNTREGSATAGAQNPAKRQWSQRRQRLLIAFLSILPPTLVACSSPDVFLAAIDFAGSYPVLLLWGIAPPWMALKLRHKHRKDVLLSEEQQPMNDVAAKGGSFLVRQCRDSKQRDSSGSDAWLVCLAVASSALVLSSAIPDAHAVLAAAVALLKKMST
jgi:tyrosine-specific transport protein